MAWSHAATKPPKQWWYQQSVRFRICFLCAESFQVQVGALDQLLAMGTLPPVAELTESESDNDHGGKDAPTTNAKTPKRKATVETPAKTNSKKHAPSSSKPAATKTPKAKAGKTPKAKAKAKAKATPKQKAKATPKAKTSDKPEPAEGTPSEAQSRSMIFLAIHFYDGIFCCQVSAKKRPAAKMPQTPKAGPSISNPQFHKGCNSWGLKLGKKLLLSVEC